MDMAEIITVTFNPCIDKSTTIPSLKPEKKMRCSPPVFEPGGGGINVARAIHKLGGAATAIYPSGGYSGKFLDILIQKEGVPARIVETREHTRENLIVLDRAANLQYRFGMPGQPLHDDEWQRCLQIIEESEAAYIVASGSLPPGLPEDILGRISDIANKKGTRLIVDSSGKALELVLQKGAFLLKPNISELCSIAGREELNENEIEAVARDLVRRFPCEIIVVSLGASGAILVSGNSVFKVASPSVRIKSTVGAGDSMVAGLTLSLSRGAGLKEALQYGVACGTAATMSPGTQLCNKEDVDKMLHIISTERN